MDNMYKVYCNSDSSSIPKRFHFIWLGRRAISKVDRACIMSWKRHNPSWNITLWCDHTHHYEGLFDEIIQIDFKKLINARRFELSHSYATKSNIIRLEIIYQQGGVYVDTDFFCNAPISPLLEGYSAFAAEQDDQFINNAIFGASAFHPSIKLAIESLEEITLSSNHCEEISTGPFLFTELYRGSHLLKIFDRSLFYPMNYRGEYKKCDYDSLATHLWANTWKED